MPKPYIPKLIWKDGKFVPNPNFKEATDNKESKLTSHGVMKECRTLFQVSKTRKHEREVYRIPNKQSFLTTIVKMCLI